MRLKLKNQILKEEFEKRVNGCILESLELDSKAQKAWMLLNPVHNDTWKIVFTGEVNAFSIYYYPKGSEKYEYRLDLLLKGDEVEIVRAWSGRHKRTEKSERFLRKYAEIAEIVACYKNLGYLKA